MKLSVIDVPVLAIFIATRNQDPGGHHQKLADLRLPVFANRAIAQHKNATPRMCKTRLTPAINNSRLWQAGNSID